MKTIKFETINTLTGETEFERETTLTPHELEVYLSRFGYESYSSTEEIYHVNENQYKKIVTVLK